MRKVLVFSISYLAASLLVLACTGVYLFTKSAGDPLRWTYLVNCSDCHGADFLGSDLGPSLLSNESGQLQSVEQLVLSISGGAPNNGMPSWYEELPEHTIRGLAILIAEQRMNIQFTDFRTDHDFSVPLESIESELQVLQLETVVSNLDKSVYSIASLPDGRLVVTEKLGGLRIVYPDGTLSDPIEGTPATGDDLFDLFGLGVGAGYLLDVAPHPDFNENGWIYLTHTEICEDCRVEFSAPSPATMVRLVRGRLVSERWQDEEVIWQAPKAFYLPGPDIGAGGRIAFDASGYVYFSIGIKGLDNYSHMPDLSSPYRKIHRIHDDGRVPSDNPFFDTDKAIPSIWTYGHRSPQGLEFDEATGNLWETEMGPRGGDEVNLLEPGKFYGWPLTSGGLNYSGTRVAYGEPLGFEFNKNGMEEPRIDLTPAPAISSFVVYRGTTFPNWQGDLIAGSLKGNRLYRFEFDDNGRHEGTEIVLDDLARIRDIDLAQDGTLYLLLEHDSGSVVVHLKPAA